MIDIEDKSYQPSLEEIFDFVELPLFNELCDYMQSEYQALHKIEYSGEKLLLGWNVKFKKAGRTLCTVYPRRGHFPLLLIVGNKERERVEMLLPELSEGFQSVYRSTPEGMGQRWMIFEFCERNAVFDDVLKIVRIRRESR